MLAYDERLLAPTLFVRLGALAQRSRVTFPNGVDYVESPQFIHCINVRRTMFDRSERKRNQLIFAYMLSNKLQRPFFWDHSERKCLQLLVQKKNCD